MGLALPNVPVQVVERPHVHGLEASDLREALDLPAGEPDAVAKANHLGALLPLLFAALARGRRQCRAPGSPNRFQGSSHAHDDGSARHDRARKLRTLTRLRPGFFRPDGTASRQRPPSVATGQQPGKKQALGGCAPGPERFIAVITLKRLLREVKQGSRSSMDSLPSPSSRSPSRAPGPRCLIACRPQHVLLRGDRRAPP